MSNSDSADAPEAESRLSSAKESKGQKVVINFLSGEIIKGYLAKAEGIDLQSPFKSVGGNNRRTITVKLREPDDTVEVALSDVKAVFFVKSFLGAPKKKSLRFYTHGPAVGEIWAEIKFKDNEIVEGLIENSIGHLSGEGFLLRPSDVESNNLAVYVNKAAIAEYRVLGIRAYREPGN